jgi:hypothetical protein
MPYRNARSITLPLSVVGIPAYHGRNALADAIAAAERRLADIRPRRLLIGP